MTANYIHSNLSDNDAKIIKGLHDHTDNFASFTIHCEVHEKSSKDSDNQKVWQLYDIEPRA